MNENNIDINKSLHIEEIKQTIDKDIPDYVRQGLFLKRDHAFKIQLGLWISFILTAVINILVFFILKTGVAVKLVTGFLSFFIFTGLILTIIFRLTISGDWDRIKQKIILIRGGYIEAIFFSTHKRIKKRYCIPAVDGRSFLLNGLPYMIDMSCVYTNEDNVPCLFYVIGIPNPLNFDFMKYLDLYFERIEKGENHLNIKEKLDVRYSSENLKLMKNDKLMADMHKDRSAEMNRLIMFFIILIGIMVFVILIIVLVTGNKTPVVNVIAQNLTNPTPVGQKFY